MTLSSLNALLGGSLLGLSAFVLMQFNGRILGVSGMVAGLLHRPSDDISARWAFIAGLITAGLFFRVFSPSVFGSATDLPLGQIAAAGILVGFGSQLANGCTSGHGICGISRLSKRSWVATSLFISAGVFTRCWIGG